MSSPHCRIDEHQEDQVESKLQDLRVAFIDAAQCPVNQRLRQREHQRVVQVRPLPREIREQGRRHSPFNENDARLQAPDCRTIPTQVAEHARSSHREHLEKKHEREPQLNWCSGGHPTYPSARKGRSPSPHARARSSLERPPHSRAQLDGEDRDGKEANPRESHSLRHKRKAKRQQGTITKTQDEPQSHSFMEWLVQSDLENAPK